MARPTPLADLIGACLGPALRAQGFASADVIAAWPEIAGERLAAFCQPIRMEWRRRGAAMERSARPEPATLVVRVESAFALEVQHLAPLVMERINTHYGWRCVGRIVLKQGPVRRARKQAAPERALGAQDRQRLAAATAAIGEEPLRAALDRLGRAVVGARADPKGGTTVSR